MHSLTAFIELWVFYRLIDARSLGIDIAIENSKVRFGRRLQYLRRSKKLTRAQLAEEVDCSIEFISFLERGINGASFAMLEKLACVLGVEVFELFLFE